MTEQTSFSGMENRVEDRRSSVSAAQLFLEEQRFGHAGYNRPDTSHAFLSNLEITSQNHYSPTDSPEVRLAKDAQNAKDQIKELMKKSGATANERDGLGMDELRALEKRTDLTPAQRRAVQYLKDNFDGLSTRRVLDDAAVTNWGWTGSLVQRRRITPDSLERNQSEAKKPSDPVPQEFKGNGPRNIPHGEPVDPRVRTQPEPADPLDRHRPGSPDRTRDVPLRKTGLGSERQRNDDVIVENNDGWIRIAEKSLRGRDEPADPRSVQSEIERLQRLNPDKTRMVHPGDRIRTR